MIKCALKIDWTFVEQVIEQKCIYQIEQSLI
jgi:hypothetical protein